MSDLDLNKEELIAKLSLKKKQLLGLRFSLRSGSLTDTSSIRKLKKDIARILTLLNK